ncbi:MAG TPA: hydroxyacylglutathione hydrolase [Cyanothece sp. UBA12306]|nr:hydroxyacylglutathione hydrolase [Cyanothece sp. UBA12306]
MKIQRISALSDNYIFLLYDQDSQTAAVVDPAEAKPVLQCLDELGLQLVAIFNTHHHYDHIGANNQLLEHFPRLCIYGGSEDRGRIPGQQVFLKDSDRIEFAKRVGQVFFLPGHTRAHIAYYFPPNSPQDTGELFCGDTLFAGGCGRLFEGTPTQMVNSLTKLRNLPDNTRIWCAHEYTLKNLEFALTIDQDNLALKNRYNQVKELRHQKQATVPSLLKEEKLTNPFLRWDNVAIQSTIGNTDPVRVFAKIRGMKDRF